MTAKMLDKRNRSLSPPNQRAMTPNQLANSRKSLQHVRNSMNKFCLAVLLTLCFHLTCVSGQEIVGVSVTPHQFSSEMRWRSQPNPELSAKTELYIRNETETDLPLVPDGLLFDGQSPQELLAAKKLAWHDTPVSWLDAKVELPPGCLTVFALNGKSAEWGSGTEHRLTMNGNAGRQFKVENPKIFLSSVTFLSVDETGQNIDAVRPNQVVAHVENHGDAMQLGELKIWLPKKKSSHHVFELARTIPSDSLDSFSPDGMIPSKSKSGFSAEIDPLPLTYCILELSLLHLESKKVVKLWAHLRIKREAFDISGGWVASNVGGRNSLAIDEYRKTLKRMHINTGQIQDVAGFTDQPDVYKQLPLKRFNRMWPLENYDTDAMLPQIHAVEFLGEPQYGGGRPVLPQQVWEKLAPYQPSRLPTSLTLSEERTWRYYAGLSDYPHFDAYRVIAPAADSWREYDRWGDKRIRWGAPLETIGNMTRSLRELSRPRPIAYWSQGAHHGWGSRWNPRRGSPNAQELRSQAWHGLSNCVTSLYWFNLSIKSLAKFPDLIEPITRVNREALMLKDLFLKGDAFEYRRMMSDDTADYDLNSIANRDSLLMVAHDLRYRADTEAREFQFERRDANVAFKVPHWLPAKLEVFRVDADGCHDVDHILDDDQLMIRDRIEVVGLYIATSDKKARDKFESICERLRASENETQFDPGNNEDDLLRLQSTLNGGRDK